MELIPSRLASMAADIVPEYKIFIEALEPWLIPETHKSIFGSLEVHF